MKLVVTNLLSNALKYSPADIAVEMIILSDPTKVHLIIQDRGIGIPSEELKRLFEPFHRASNVGTIKGTGLGLSITKEIVEIHGGQVAIESALGQGTKVQVSLPLF